MNKNGEGYAAKRNADGSRAESADEYKARRRQAELDLRNRGILPPNEESSKSGKNAKSQDELLLDIKNANEEYAQNQTKEAKKKLKKARKQYDKYIKKASPGTLKVGKWHMQRALNLNNTFVVSGAQGKTRWAAIRNGIFGTKTIDPKTGKKVSNGDAMYQKLSPFALLGITKEDKKELGEALKLAGKTLSGMLGMFIGMGTIVAHPKVGLGALAGGAVLMGQSGKKLRKKYGYPKNKMLSYKGKYTNARFGTSAVKNMKNTIEYSAERETNAALIRQLRKSALGMRLLVAASTVGVATLGLVTGGIGIIPAAALGTAAAGITASGVRFRAKYINKDHSGMPLNDYERSVLKRKRQELKQFKEFEKDAATTMREAILRDADVVKGKQKRTQVQRDENQAMEKEYSRRGYRYDSKTGETTDSKRSERPILFETPNTDGMDIHNRSDVQRELENDETVKNESNAFEQALVSLYASQGLEYDPSTGKVTPIETSMQNEENEAKRKENSPKNIVQKRNNEELTQIDVTLIYKEIEAALSEVAGSEEIDMASEATYDQVRAKVADRLFKAGLLSESQRSRPESLFRKQDVGFKTTLKDKAVRLNVKIQANNQVLEQRISKPDADDVREAISQIIKGDGETEAKDIGKITVQDIVEKINAKRREENRGAFVTEGVFTPKNSQSSDSSDDTDVPPVMPVPMTETDKERVGIIGQYLKNLQEESRQAATTESLAHTIRTKVKYDIEPNANAKVNARNQKLKQIIELDIDSIPDGSETDPLQVTYEKVRNLQGTGGTVDGSDLQISPEDVNSNLEMLLLVKELRALNDASVETIGIERKRNTEDVRRALELTRELQQNMNIVRERGESDRAGRAAKQEVDRINAELQTLNEKRIKEEKRQNIEGPFIKIDDVLTGADTNRRNSNRGRNRDGSRSHDSRRDGSRRYDGRRDGNRGNNGSRQNRNGNGQGRRNTSRPRPKK